MTSNPHRRFFRLRAFLLFTVALLFSLSGCTIIRVKGELPYESTSADTSAPVPPVMLQTEKTEEIIPLPDTEKKSVSVTKVFENLTEKTIPATVRNILINYYDERYEALGRLEPVSLAHYFETNDKYGNMYAEFNDTVLDYLIYVRKNRTADLSYKKADYRISVTDCHESEYYYNITYMIYEAVDFACTGKTSYSGWMEVDAKFKKINDTSYKLVELAEDTDVNILFEEKVMKYLGYDEFCLKDINIPDGLQAERMLESINKALKASADKDIKKQAEFLEKVNAQPHRYVFNITAKNPYNYKKAVAYSYKWAGKNEIVRNSEYSDFSQFGGNCQNYVSQCLHESGIPMDYTGNADQQWKWYSDYVNEYGTAWGRSTSWSGTEYFYNYCKNNTGSGLVAVSTAVIYAAKPGDIMQYVVDDWASHSVIVSDIIYDDDGNIIEILINSNTTDHVDYPLTAYGYTDIRLIHIVGYN